MVWGLMLLAWVVLARARRRHWRRWGRPPVFGVWMNPYQRAWLFDHNWSRMQHMQFGPQPRMETKPAEQHLTPAQARDRKIAEVRRRYVADEITVEDYEREVDAILKH